MPPPPLPCPYPVPRLNLPIYTNTPTPPAPAPSAPPYRLPLKRTTPWSNSAILQLNTISRPPCGQRVKHSLSLRIHTHPWAKLLHCVCTACALLGHCVCTACILRTQRPGYSPKNTCHLIGCTATQQSPHENNETAFNLVLHCPYEQTTQPCTVRLLRVFRCPWLRSWRRR